MSSILVWSMPGTLEFGVIILLGLVIPLLCIFDIMQNSFRGLYTKWVWCAIVVFIPVIGSLLYYWIGREQRVIS